MNILEANRQAALSYANKRLLISWVEVKVEDPRRDSEYDSDLILVGNGHKCRPISETLPNLSPSGLRILPAPLN
jgi:hypothetical protein